MTAGVIQYSMETDPDLSINTSVIYFRPSLLAPLDFNKLLQIHLNNVALINVYLYLVHG